MTGRLPPPGGLAGWILDDDARTARARSVLYPICATAVVVTVCLMVAALVFLAHASPLVTGLSGGVAALLGIAGPAGIRAARNKRDRARVTSAVEPEPSDP